MNEVPSSGQRAGGRRRTARLGAPYLFPLALVAAAGFLVWSYRAELASVDLSVAAAGPETQVREALAHQDRAALDDVYGFRAGGTAELRQVRFADVAVSVGGDRAQVVAVVEAEGTVRWRTEQAALSYVGREAFGMAPCKIALWCADGEQYVRLRGVLTALFRRADAEGTRDLDAAARLVSEAYAGPGGKAAVLERLRERFRAPAPARHVRSWQIRVERDRAQVGEDYELASSGAERLRERFTVVREGERWLFVDGL